MRDTCPRFRPGTIAQATYPASTWHWDGPITRHPVDAMVWEATELQVGEFVLIVRTFVLWDAQWLLFLRNNGKLNATVTQIVRDGEGQNFRTVRP